MACGVHAGLPQVHCAMTIRVAEIVITNGLNIVKPETIIA